MIYRFPSDIALPDTPPEKPFSEEVIRLNQQAIEIAWKDPNEAFSLLDKAIANDPNYHMPYANKGTLLLSQKEYTKAKYCFEKLVVLRPRAAEYYIGLAYCLHQLGEPQQTQEQLRKSLSAYNIRIRQNQNIYFNTLNRAIVLYLLEKKPLAIRELKELQKSSQSLESNNVGILLQEIEKSQMDPWTVLGFESK